MVVRLPSARNLGSSVCPTDVACSRRLWMSDEVSSSRAEGQCFAIKMEQLKQKIRLSHEAGRMPSTSKNGNFTLKLGDRKY